MKTANVVNTMLNQNGASSAPKNNPMSLEENSFSAHFNRELNTTSNNKISVNSNSNNNIKSAKSAKNAEQNSKATDSTTIENNKSASSQTSAPETGTSATSPSTETNDDKDKNNSHLDDNSPLMLLFGAMSTVPKIDLPITAKSTDDSGKTINATTVDLTATSTTNSLPLTATIESDASPFNEPTGTFNSAFSQKLIDAKDVIAEESKTLTTDESKALPANLAASEKIGLTTTNNEEVLTASLQNKLEKLTAAITPQAPNSQAVIANIAAAVAPAGTSNTQITQPFGSTGWDKAVGQKVLWMVGESIHSAELSLNPPDLGPLQIVLKVTNEHASASFMCSQPEVREALESSMPKLRQMMSDAGIELSSFSVNTQASNQGQQGSGYRPNSQEWGQTSSISSNTQQIDPTLAVSNASSRVFTSRIGEVDTFA